MGLRTNLTPTTSLVDSTVADSTEPFLVVSRSCIIVECPSIFYRLKWRATEANQAPWKASVPWWRWTYNFDLLALFEFTWVVDKYIWVVCQLQFVLVVNARMFLWSESFGLWCTNCVIRQSTHLTKEGKTCFFYLQLGVRLCHLELGNVFEFFLARILFTFFCDQVTTFARQTKN